MSEYDDEIKAFYEHGGTAEIVSRSECELGEHDICLAQHVLRGHLLQRKSDKYFLVEIIPGIGRWNSYFAKDRKDVLQAIIGVKKWFSDW